MRAKVIWHSLARRALGILDNICDMDVDATVILAVVYGNNFDDAIVCNNTRHGR
jgi:hypothetical protein